MLIISWDIQIDRHVRALDLAIEEQEQAIAAGIRPGTRPAAIVIPKGSSSPSHGHSHSYESNGLLALAEVASAVAEKTLESMQPLPSAGSTVLTWNDKEAPIEEKPTTTGKKEASKPKVQLPKRDRKKRNAAAKEEVADPNEPTYCYCDRVSFGNVSTLSPYDSDTFAQYSIDDRLRWTKLQERMGMFYSLNV